MGNQAQQQNRELELWQVVSTPGNARSHARSDRHRRRNTTNYSRTAGARRAGTDRMGSAGHARADNARYAKMARPDRTRRAETTRMAHSRPASQRGASRQIQTISSRAPRTGSGRSRTVQMDMPGVRQRSVYEASYRQRRTVLAAQPPRTHAKVQSIKRKKAGRHSRGNQYFTLLWVAVMCIVTVYMAKSFYRSAMREIPSQAKTPTVKSAVEEETAAPVTVEKRPEIEQNFLTVSEYNRPGTTLAQVNNIFVHYTANPGTSAAQNRSYFENLGQTHERAASAHFIIGYEGEIIQCIPLHEEAYAVVERNGDSISIECCYLDKDGAFTQETYDSLIEMLAWLIDKYDLEPEDILRHYDCGGKLCPIYYVKHEDAWQKLLDDVANFNL